MKRGVVFFVAAVIYLFFTIVFCAGEITNSITKIKSIYSGEVFRSTNSLSPMVSDKMPTERWINIDSFEKVGELSPLWNAIDFQRTKFMKGEAEDIVRFNLWPSLGNPSSGPLIISEYPISSTYSKKESMLIGWHFSFSIR